MKFNLLIVRSVIIFLFLSHYFNIVLAGLHDHDIVMVAPNHSLGIKRSRAIKDDSVATQSKRQRIADPFALDSIAQFKIPTELFSKGTVIVTIDVDNTLVKYQYLLANLSNEKLLQFILPELAHMSNAAQQEFLRFLDNDPQFRQKVISEPAWFKIVESLASKGAKILVLTARRYSGSEKTYALLQHQGLDFAVLSALGNLEKFHSPLAGLDRGIFSTGGELRKVAYISEIVDEVRTATGAKGPFYVFHIDDNLQELAAFVSAKAQESPGAPIQLFPYHYRALDNQLLDTPENRLIMRQEVGLLIKRFGHPTRQNWHECQFSD